MTYVVIAAYNEAATVQQVVASLKGYNVIVVDDGSQDSTGNAARQAGATVIRHIVNRGQGASLQTGISYALKKGAEQIITFDADGQHDPKDIPRIVKALQDVDVVFGSRFLGKSHVPFWRKLLLKAGILLVWLFYGTKMTDVHNGLRGFTRRAALQLDVQSDRMGHASEIIDWVKKENIRYKEVPVTIRYSKKRQGHGSYAQAIRVFADMIWRKLLE